MLRDDLKLKLQTAIAGMADRGLLPAEGLPEVEIADPRDPSHGDFACNFALVASKAVGKPPREIAEALKQALIDGDDGAFAAIEVAGPGFLNLRLTPAFVAAYVSAVLGAEKFGWSQSENPLKINVEYVSVNPNGPITIGSGRGAAFGSTLSNVLEAAGNQVHREYYINDGTNSEQMRQFGRSVLLEALGALGVPVNEEISYKGEYVASLSNKVVDELLVSHIATSRGMDERDTDEMLEHCTELLDTLYAFPNFDRASLWVSGIDGFTASVLNLMLNIEDGYEPFEDDEDHAYAVFVRAFILADYYDDNFPDGIPDPATYFDSDRRQRVKLANELLNLAERQRERPPNWLDTKLITPDSHSIYQGIRSIDRDLLLILIDEYLDPEATQEVRDHVEENLRELAQGEMLRQQKASLETFGCKFDTWFSEQSLHDLGAVDSEIAKLENRGAADSNPFRFKLKLAKGGVPEDVEIETQPVDDDDSASGSNPTLWLRSTKFGDDMDRVLRRRDGRLTYISSDIAYHKDKFNRPENADKLITILGPDHHGYIGRLTAVLAAVDFAEAGGGQASTRGGMEATEVPLSEVEAKIYASAAERDACQAALEKAKRELEVVIFQLVRFMKDGKPAPMRKRDGNIYALIDLIKEIGQHARPNASEQEQLTVGRDVARFFYLMRSHDTTFDFDLNLAEKQSDENPVFYVQYAHARICSLVEKAKEAGFDPEMSSDPTTQLTHEREHALVKKICDLPHEVKRCAEDYGVHRLTTYAMELARAYHAFYDACRVIDPEQRELSQARLSLCLATRKALRATFDLLGIDAPERMDR